MSKTHFKKLRNPNFIGSFELATGDGYGELVVTITDVKQEQVANGDKTEMCMIVHLKETKPMICNSTNAKAITSALKTPFIEDWIGKRITLYVAKIRAFGETHDALRVRPTAPAPIQKPKPVLNPQSDRWAPAVTALKSKSTTMDAIKKAYQITPEHETLLINEAAK